jgi:glycosyltransferase involved in cell wall biosynthesis
MIKPRILIIENSIAVTGALKSILRSSEGLTVHYNFVFLLPKNSSAAKYAQDLGFEVHELAMRELRKNIYSLLAYFPVLLFNSFLLSHLIRKLKIDLIVVNDFYNLLTVCYRVLAGKVPYVCYVRFLPSKFPKGLVRFWCKLHQRYASEMIAVSMAVKSELPFKEKVVVIGNELPSDDVAFTSATSSIILYPANYIQGKGHEYALQSFASINKKHPQWKLKFVGGDMGLQKNKDFKKSLIELAHKLDITEQVEWHDFANNISAEYIQACFVLNFSESESFSMTCLEAMFYGRPVIATRSGGPSEIIDQNKTGILVDIDDVASMAKAMDYLIVNSDKREIMAQHAYLSVREKFSYANTVEKLGEVYENALKTS